MRNVETSLPPVERTTKRGQRIVIRATTLTFDEANQVEREAEAAGLPVGDYIRACLLSGHRSGAATADVVLAATAA